MSYEEIAKACGYKSASGAHQAVKAALKKTIKEPADELRNLELQRLDEAQAAIWAAVKAGNLRAIDRFLKISRRRSELLGINAPVQVGVNGSVTFDHNVTLSVEEIDRLRDDRWQRVRNTLAQLPTQSIDAAFTAVEIDNETVRGEKVTTEEIGQE